MRIGAARAAGDVGVVGNDRQLRGAHFVGDASLWQTPAQARGWCQAMCLNVGRTRRRLRKTLADGWRHLSQHAANADASPELQHHLAAASWHWRQHDADGYDLQARARRAFAGRHACRGSGSCQTPARPVRP